MNLKLISPDQVVLWRWGPVVLNLTLVTTWALMALIAGGAWLAARRLSTGPGVARWQHLLELLVVGIRGQIREVAGAHADRYLPFIGTLFVFVVVANLLAVVPGYVPPTASLSTTVALALCVFIAVPLYGVASRGLRPYLAQYVKPTPLMLPFNVIGELSRTLALAVRLFGNMMSGAKIGAILLAVAPLLFPVVMQLLGLLTGLIQAYIFAVLAMVYIASATQAHEATTPDDGGS